MKITQQEREQFRQLISDVGAATDPYFRTKTMISNGKVCMIEVEIL